MQGVENPLRKDEKMVPRHARHAIRLLVLVCSCSHLIQQAVGAAVNSSCIGPAVPRLWVTLAFGDAYNTTQLVGVQSLSAQKHSQYEHVTLVVDSPQMELSLAYFCVFGTLTFVYLTSRVPN